MHRVLLAGMLAALGGVVGADHHLESDLDEAVSTFVSQPGLRPPEVIVDRAGDRLGPAHIFVAPWRGEHQAGPMILDHGGRLVWFHRLPAGRVAMDFRVQQYRGRPVLTWWEGQVLQAGYGLGEYVVADRSYREIMRLRTGRGRLGDFHEFLLTPRGTVLITIYRQVRRDLSPLGGPENGTVVESIVQEVEVDTGRLLYEWRALDHVAMRESHEPVPNEAGEPFDFFHINSVDVDHDGNLLLSARHTDTVYKIDRQTGQVIWRLGGKRSDFAFDPGARFFSQHDARRQPDGTLTLFDNGAPPRRRPYSRAVTLRLDRQAGTARLVGGVRHPAGLLADSQGNAQALPGGDVFVGWGSQPYFSQFDARGNVEFDAHFPDETNIYRAYRSPWAGSPQTRPAVATEVDDEQLTVLASWNGATEVTRWRLLAGPRPATLRPVTSAAGHGFETTIRAPGQPPYIAVRAESEGGLILGRSRTVSTQP